MVDFIISALVSLFVNVVIVVPFLDPLRNFLVESGRMTEIEAGKFYYLAIFVVFLIVGMITYLVLALLKDFLSKF